MRILRIGSRLALVGLVATGVSAGTAMAAEGNGDPFGLENSQLAVTGQPVETQTGSQAYPGFDPRVRVPVVIGGVARADGAQGEPEPRNSLASAPEIGGVWAAQPAQS